jgi:hypothetical protein
MATVEASNAFFNTARQLLASQNLPVHEQIFREALQDAQNEASNEEDRKLLTVLASIRDEASMKRDFEQKLQAARATGPAVKKRFSRRISRSCEKIDRIFEIFWRISEASAFVTSACLATVSLSLDQLIAKPVVGVICFFIMVCLRQ